MAEDFPEVSLARAALLCRCPRCGQGPVFAGLLTVRQHCPVCTLDLSAQDPGDAPAVFVILFLGLIVVGLAAFVELTFSPPLWVHIVLWTPLILVGAIGMLRPLKAAMIAIHYRYYRVEAPPSA